MPTLSKFFFERHFSHYKCCDLIHPWEKSCNKAHLSFLTSCFVGAVKYYGLFYLVSALLKYKEWNEKYMMEHLICYSKSLLAGTLVGSSFIINSCYIRMILGKYYYYTCAFLPGTLAGLFISIITPSKRDAISQVYLQLIMESFVNKLENNGTIKLRHVGISTICFMLSNAYFLYLLRLEANKDASKRKYPIWIFRPPSSKKSTTDNPCAHSERESCVNYILQAVTCYLCQKYRKDDPTYALFGGFACGAVYPFFPFFNLLLTVVSSSLYIHIWKYEKKYKIPITILLFAICLGYSFNLRYFMPDVCPKTASKIITSITNGKADIITENLNSATVEIQKNISSQLMNQRMYYN